MSKRSPLSRIPHTKGSVSVTNNNSNKSNSLQSWNFNGTVAPEQGTRHMAACNYFSLLTLLHHCLPKDWRTQKLSLPHLQIKVSRPKNSQRFHARPGSNERTPRERNSSGCNKTCFKRLCLNCLFVLFCSLILGINTTVLMTLCNKLRLWKTPHSSERLGTWKAKFD